MNRMKQLLSFFQSPENQADMFKLLDRMVSIQSGSYHKNGVDRMSELIRTVMSGLPFSVQTIPQESLGDHLIARSERTKTSRRQILMVGHMDTVFPEDTNFTQYTEDTDYCYGPGVIDMKGGLAAGIFALKALDAAGILPEMPVTFIFNSDEEIGSPGSREIIREEAGKSAFAFVLECGGLNGEIVTGRKGVIRIQVDVYGKAGHAASAGPDKASAVLELARKIIALEALNDPERRITANAGKIEGGIGSNTIPEHARADVDFRILEPADGIELEQKIQKIVDTCSVPGTRAQAAFMSKRPPMPASQANMELFAIIENTARWIGQSVISEVRSGVSDANIIAGMGVPVVDGLGPLGARDHSSDEYMIKKALPERAALIACGLYDAWNVYFQ